MNRKHNPWVALVALLLLVTLVVCTGCAGCTEAAAEEAPSRFTIEMTQRIDGEIDILSIVLDTETGVRYLFVDGYNGVGITPLLSGEEGIA